MRAFGLTLLFISLAACGGATTSDLFSDGGTDDGSGGGNDGGKSDARTDGAASCSDLLAKVNDLRKKAVVCNPQSGGTQCDKQVEDLCCPLTVSGGDRKEVLEFIAAVKAAKAASCSVACSGVPCAVQPSNKCDTNATCRQFGG